MSVYLPSGIELLSMLSGKSGRDPRELKRGEVITFTDWKEQFSTAGAGDINDLGLFGWGYSGGWMLTMSHNFIAPPSDPDAAIRAPFNPTAQINYSNGGSDHSVIVDCRGSLFVPAERVSVSLNNPKPKAFDILTPFDDFGIRTGYASAGLKPGMQGSTSATYTEYFYQSAALIQTKIPKGCVGYTPFISDLLLPGAIADIFAANVFYQVSGGNNFTGPEIQQMIADFGYIPIASGDVFYPTIGQYPTLQINNGTGDDLSLGIQWQIEI